MDLQILADDIQCIELLAFVFMQTLYLNIEDGLRIAICTVYPVVSRRMPSSLP